MTDIYEAFASAAAENYTKKSEPSNKKLFTHRRELQEDIETTPTFNSRSRTLGNKSKNLLSQLRGTINNPF